MENVENVEDVEDVEDVEQADLESENFASGSTSTAKSWQGHRYIGIHRLHPVTLQYSDRTLIIC